MAEGGARAGAPAGLDGAGLRVGVVRARWNAAIVDRLAEGVERGLKELGVAADDVIEVPVPGSFEIPFGARALASSGRVDAVICIGAVIRGETTHYDYVCGEAARGILDVQLSTGVPCAFGVLTVATMEQALARAGGGKRDRMGHTIHHQALPLDEELVHAERERDRELGRGGGG